MKITVEFDSFEEVNAFTSSVWCGAKPVEPVAVKEKKTTKKEPVAKEVIAEPEVAEDEKVVTIKESAETVETEKIYNFTEVRGVLATLAKTDSTKVAAILKEFGASKLSEIKEEDYAAVMERAGA